MFFGEETIVLVQLRYLIGCVSVVGHDGSIYQYPIPQHGSDNESERFGTVRLCLCDAIFFG